MSTIPPPTVAATTSPSLTVARFLPPTRSATPSPTPTVVTSTTTDPTTPPDPPHPPTRPMPTSAIAMARPAQSPSPPTASSPSRRKRAAADTVAVSGPSHRGPSTGTGAARASTDPVRGLGMEGGRRWSPITGGGHRGNTGSGSDPGMGRIGRSHMERREARVMDMGATMGLEVSIGGARRKGMAAWVGTGGLRSTGIGESRATRGRAMAGMRRGVGGTRSRATMVKSKGKDMAALNMAMTLMMRKRSTAITTTTITTVATMMMTEPFAV